MTITSTDIDQSRFTVANLEKMRERFPGVDDNTLARYLIARNNDLEKATALLQKASIWRKAHWPVLKSSCINEINKGKIYVQGTDKEGRPLIIYRARFHNCKDRDLNEMAKMAVWWTEIAISKLAPNHTKYTILIDRTDFSNDNGDIEFMRHFSSIFQDTYPERLQRAIVYPSGFLFYALYNVVKWFMDPVTREKTIPVLALSGVQQYIDDEYIPVDMGGKCTYVFNPNEFSDPYPQELIDAKIAADAAGAAAEGDLGEEPQSLPAEAS